MNPIRPLDAVLRLEEMLGGDRDIQFAVRLSSGDSVSAEFEGSVDLRPSGDALIDLQGELNSVVSRFATSADGRRLIVQAQGREVDIQAPDRFRAVLAAGFVRLGLLDLVLRVLSGNPPRSADALRREYHLEALTDVEAEPSRPDLADCLGHAYIVRNYDIEVATATLWIDRFRGYPRERSQSIRPPVRLTSTEVYWEFQEH